MLVKSAVFTQYIDGGAPDEHNIQIKSAEVTLKAPEGGILVECEVLSADPYLRGRMNSTAAVGEPFAIGEPMTNYGVGKVIESNNTDYAVGDFVRSMTFPFSTAFAVDKETLEKFYSKFDPLPNVPLSYYVGALGMPGRAALYAIEHVVSLVAGKTILVTTAAGAVGQLVCSVSKAKGLKVVAVAGSDEKIKYLKDVLKVDAAWNYKKEKLSEAMDKYIPQGIDYYYDNVGGEMTDVAVEHMNIYGTVISCGNITQYNLKPEELYRYRYPILVNPKRLKVQGFVILDIELDQPEIAAELNKSLGDMASSGKIKCIECVYEGIESTAKAMNDLLTGKNFGKVVIKLK
ncbi:hypothetical protein V1511DRAFT_179061 [Dipodascopsis uninucleata]